jgi:hypothetical protein
MLNPNGSSVTSVHRTVRPNKEDRVAKLEWGANGGLGRVIMGKVRELLSVITPHPLFTIFAAHRAYDGPGQT